MWLDLNIQLQGISFSKYPFSLQNLTAWTKIVFRYGKFYAKRLNIMDNFIKFFIELGKLKTTRRTGWLLREVRDPESIADHSFRLGILAWLLPQIKKYDIDTDKVLKMGLIHDMCEVYAGDATPYDDLVTPNAEENRELLAKWPRRNKEEKERLALLKHEKEKKGLEKLLSLLPNKIHDEFMDLWMEYENGDSREGRFVRQLDRLETLMQALEYEDEKRLLSIKSFWEQVKELIDDPILLEFMEELDNYFYLGHNNSH